MQTNAVPTYFRVHARWFLLAIVLLFALHRVPASAQGVPPANGSWVNAEVLYNFARFIDWPGEAFSTPTDPLQVCVFGESSAAGDFEKFLRDKVAQQRRMKLQLLSSPPLPRQCHILFVARAPREQVLQLVEHTRDFSVLTVGDNPDFLADGGIVKLVPERDRVRFDVNLDAADRARLKVSSKLLAVARVVYRRAYR